MKGSSVYKCKERLRSERSSKQHGAGVQMFWWCDISDVCSFRRTGMLALEMLGRRAHNDHPNNFSRSPPYTEDVKWLLGLAARLGERQGIVGTRLKWYVIINIHHCMLKK